ncbi:MAG: hypothetical protein J7518_12215 [Nocardioidaceae bacterium]|nr:hypothetical protein [Nocardioidaceae bacterium]
MAQNHHQRRAADAVAARMAHLEWNNSQLVAVARVDAGTVGDFLNGKRWPKIGTQGKIEKALSWPLGMLRAIAAGAAVPDPADPEGNGTKAEESDDVRFRRPAGLDSAQWTRIRERAESYLAWQVEQELGPR